MPIRPIVNEGTVAEVEVSITASCTLACDNCGFLVPNQPKPSHGDAVDELAQGLGHIARCGVRIRSLAIVGGEPTLNAALLTRAVLRFRGVSVAGRIEVVSNGLTPQGVSASALAAIDRFTISNYGYDGQLVDLWRRWLAAAAPHVELVLRDGQVAWDPWGVSTAVSAAEAQTMWNSCWYRRHCVTVERGRLFACSRIPKLSRDAEGLVLTPKTTFGDIEGYLNGSVALPSCSTCTPMMGLPTLTGGVQPDDRIQRLQRRAIACLQARLDAAKIGGEMVASATGSQGEGHGR